MWVSFVDGHRKRGAGAGLGAGQVPELSVPGAGRQTTVCFVWFLRGL